MNLTKAFLSGHSSHLVLKLVLTAGKISSCALVPNREIQLIQDKRQQASTPRWSKYAQPIGLAGVEAQYIPLYLDSHSLQTQKQLIWPGIKMYS